MSALPKIVIVGRPNVGKSSLLNMLARRRVSIVDPTAGVTRDRVSTTIEIPPPRENPGGESLFAELIDTGGMGIEDSMQLTVEVEQQIANGLAEADVVLFVVDAQTGVVPLDNTVARALRTSRGSGTQSKPVLLVANKVDADNLEAAAYETAALGFGEPICVSAVTKYHLYDFYDVLRKTLKENVSFDGAREDTEPGIKLALVGKRNAGKSTLINALAGSERVIVSEQAGTTRDSVDVKLELDTKDGKKTFTCIDTAGVRKTKSLSGDIEFYSQHRSLRSVRRADVCLLLIDAAVPVSQVDHQLVGEINKHHRPTVIVVNKWDLAQENYTQEEYVEYLDQSLKGLPFAPIIFISASQAEGMEEVVAMALNLHEQASHRMTTSELNQFIEQIMTERGPSASKGGKQAKIYYATQLETNPPTIVLFVNIPDLFDHNYQTFLMNRMRDELPFSEVPIRLLVRGKPKMHAEDRIASREYDKGK
ncbi:MAG: ribosome biogenesis GTPase Der [Planctomycetota bacterium]